ncbi:hypothetical protein IG631_10934 [Alternaria alternata]|nr:hypothetical protein IG631_10934 [Alternaria alternata]
MESWSTRKIRVLEVAPGFSAHRPNVAQTMTAGPRSCLVHLDHTGPIVTQATSLYIDNHVARSLAPYRIQPLYTTRLLPRAQPLTYPNT